MMQKIAICAPSHNFAGHAMKAQKTATKTQMYFQQKRKCGINKTATCITPKAQHQSHHGLSIQRQQ